MTGYQLYHQEEGYDGGGWGHPWGTFPSLTAAMEAAGHADPSHWLTTVGIPDVITVDWVHHYDPAREYEDDEYLYISWAVEAPGVAAEYTDLLTSDVPPGATS